MATVKIKVGSNWENIALSTYPVGSVYISYVNTSPATLFGGTWSQITTGVLRMANNTNTGGSDTFTIASKNLPTHTHTVGAHSHGLNSHKHSVGAHSHGLNSHTHTYAKVNSPTGGTAITIANLPKNYATFTMRKNSSNGQIVYADTNCSAADSSRSDLSQLAIASGIGKGTTITLSGSGTTHSHTTSTTSTNSGAASGSTANSTAFDSGAASGSTANSTAFESGNGGFANEAISNLPAYQNLYAWRRTA